MTVAAARCTAVGHGHHVWQPLNEGGDVVCRWCGVGMTRGEKYLWGRAQAVSLS